MMKSANNIPCSSWPELRSNSKAIHGGEWITLEFAVQIRVMTMGGGCYAENQ